MGALHEGHASLIRRAASECDHAWISIFVNPLQFGPTEDFNRYPRSEAQDIECAKQAGCTLVFAPDVATLIPQESTLIHVPEVGDEWEGAHRPGHFVGVATIVLKLFNLVRPTVAYFGWKDFQQCAVLRRMVEDLFHPVDLVFCETVRESDGLAMSSRNRYLSPEERGIAPSLYRTLMEAKTLLAKGNEASHLILDTAKRKLTDEGFTVDYFAWVDGATLEAISGPRAGARLIAAVKLGQTRLIDNVSTD